MDPEVAAEALPANIHKAVRVPAPLSAVWEAWTTEAGLRRFFAPAARMSLRRGGPFELLFALDMPAGLRGSEGCEVLGFEAERWLEVSWNFPPTMSIRDEHTRVRLDFQAVEGGTRVELLHDQWRAGEEWAAGRAYFHSAWDLVLGRLRHAFAEGDVDWERPARPTGSLDIAAG